VLANNTQFGDPCFGNTKWLQVQVLCSATSSITASFSVPTNKIATVAFPLLTLSQVTLKESGGAVWSNGQYQSGVAGVSSAAVDVKTNTLRVNFGSGDYSFMLTGVEGTHVCGQGAENATITLTCPTNTAVSRVNFASFGNATATCASTVFTRGVCHAGSSKIVVERACLGKSSCQVLVSDTVFGDPCYNTVKPVCLLVGWVFFFNGDRYFHECSFIKNELSELSSGTHTHPYCGQCFLLLVG
jgi:hypothetical protein